MNNHVKLLVGKLIGFTCCIVILQVGMLHFIPALALSVHPYVTLLKQEIQNNPDILYFGDSVIGSYSTQDQDQRSIAAMLQERLPDYKIGAVHGPGLGMDMFLAFSRYVVHQRHAQIIIVPINMRSFSLDWEGPGWGFGKEKAYLRYYDNNEMFRLFFRALTVFKAFEPGPTAEYEYENRVVFSDSKPIGRVKDIRWNILGSLTRDRQKVLSYYYMYSLTPEHRFVKDMLELANLLQENHITVVFYLTPIDYKSGEANLGQKFTIRLRENTQLIKQLLISKNVPLLDLSQSLETDKFNWELQPNEHLNEYGRMFVADELAKYIQAHHS